MRDNRGQFRTGGRLSFQKALLVMTTLNFRARVPVFDANVGVGHRRDRPSPIESREQLLEEMDRHGVARALIYHLQGEALSAPEGNESLLPWVDGQSALHPQWVADPTPECLDQLQQLHQQGQVTNVRLHHTLESRLPFVDWIYGELLEWLAAQHIPLWLSLADTPAAEVRNTLRQFPDLVTVLLGAHYAHSAVVGPLLRQLPKAHLELSRYEGLGKLPPLIREFGIQRLVYGSFYPRYAMGPILFSLHHLGLDASDLESLCSGNLERILGEGRNR